MGAVGAVARPARAGPPPSTAAEQTPSAAKPTLLSSTGGAAAARPARVSASAAASAANMQATSIPGLGAVMAMPSTGPGLFMRQLPTVKGTGLAAEALEQSAAQALAPKGERAAVGMQQHDSLRPTPNYMRAQGELCLCLSCLCVCEGDAAAAAKAAAAEAVPKPPVLLGTAYGRSQYINVATGKPHLTAAKALGAGFSS